MGVSANPLTPSQWEALNRLLEGATTEQIAWLGGYLAGFAAARGDASAQHVTPARRTETGPPVAVLFGSQTGNAEKLARLLHARLTEQGLPARLDSMASYKISQLKRERILLVVVSTYGEGDPPDSVQGFHEDLFSARAPKLEGLQFSVLALGDSSYEHFCKTGADFDQRFEALGARRIETRVDLDVDYDEAADLWMGNVLEKLKATGVEGSAPGKLAVRPESAGSYSKKNPYPARLLANLRLTGRGSTKDVRHIELSIEDSGLAFEPGDSLSVIASNWPLRLAELLDALGLDGNTSVAGADGGETTLEQALLRDYEITTLTRPFLEKYAQISESGELGDLLKEENRTNLRDYLRENEIIDVVRQHPVPGISADRFLSLLRKLQPRQYSIASSLLANPDEVHLTVGVVRYESHGSPRHGVASTFLADRVGDEGMVPVYVDENPNFRLPPDPNAAVIMVGAGTGVAPFRAFLEERQTVGALGKNWLFFGDRNFTTDFLYQREWLEHRKNGLLTKLDVAFSRDSDKKVYVQHKMLENGRQIYSWLQEGAYFFVCGDAQRMAPDVHEALISLVAKESGQSRERAIEYVKELQANKRYQRDIY